MFSAVSRRDFWRAPALAFCVGLLTFGGAASAGEVRPQYANSPQFANSPQYANSDVSAFGAPALSDQELNRERGAGLDDEGTVSFEDGDNLAVILWDELKRSGGGNGDSGSTSYNLGVGSNLSSTISGQAD